MNPLLDTTRRAVSRLVGPTVSHQLHRGLQRPATRVRAHLTEDGRRSTRALRACRNEFRGQRAVIIGNGPSLRQTDLSLLKNEYTFGLNRVYLAFEDFGFPTTFLVSINELVISQVAEELAAVPSRTFFRWSSRKHFPPGTRATFVQSLIQPGFHRDVTYGLWEGSTVTNVALQLAFHMGFTSVVLVGVDHSFTTKGPANVTVESEGDDPNHFHPSYFGRGFRWQLPDLETSEVAYRLARDAYEAAGRTVVDATVGGKLDVFPKVDLETALLDNRLPHVI
jgi:hypothetical protein